MSSVLLQKIKTKEAFCVIFVFLFKPFKSDANVFMLKETKVLIAAYIQHELKIHLYYNTRTEHDVGLYGFSLVI